MRQAAVIITGWFEADDHRPAEAGQGGNQTVVLCASIGHGQPRSAHARTWIDETFMAVLGDFDGYKRGPAAAYTVDDRFIASVPSLGDLAAYGASGKDTLANVSGIAAEHVRQLIDSGQS